MFDISAVTPFEYILLIAGLLSGVAFVVFGPGRYRQLLRVVRMQGLKADELAETADKAGGEDRLESEAKQQEGAKQQVCESEPAPNMPRISIIAYTQGHPDEVGAFLQAVSEQDYPDKEVVVVVNGSARDTANLVETFTDAYPFASFSFVPPEALNLSRRKLANTIGIKKATGEIILTTLTNIKIPSRQWLSLMASQFAEPDVEIVLGAALMDLTRLIGPKRRYRCFDTLLTTARWMLSAIYGRPYRGDGANLAFRRSLFFRNSGYGNNYYLHSGDDDIFVSQVATAANSRFMFAPQATVRVDWGDASRRIWINLKQRYDFAQRFLKTAPRHRPYLVNAFLWLSTLCLSGGIAVSVCSEQLLVGVIAAALLLGLWSCQIAMYRPLAGCFGCSRLWWTVPLFYLLHAPADLCFSLCHRRSARRNFTYLR